MARMGCKPTARHQATSSLRARLIIAYHCIHSYQGDPFWIIFIIYKREPEVALWIGVWFLARFWYGSEFFIIGFVPGFVRFMCIAISWKNRAVSHSLIRAIRHNPVQIVFRRCEETCIFIAPILICHLCRGSRPKNEHAVISKLAVVVHCPGRRPRFVVGGVFTSFGKLKFRGMLPNWVSGRVCMLM